METLIPWTKLLAVLEPFHPKGGRGRERMLRIYFLQPCLSDRASQLVHTVVVTVANVADVTKTAELLPGRATQSLGASVRGASLPHGAEPLPASKGEVSRTGQEQASTRHALWPGQRADRRADGGGDLIKVRPTRGYRKKAPANTSNRPRPTCPSRFAVPRGSAEPSPVWPTQIKPLTNAPSFSVSLGRR